VGSSFPSGHTILITAFLAAVWRYYPRCRLLAVALLLALAAALLLSSYHFVSDIIMGVYCGILITTGTAHFLSKARTANL
jgi:membrane-associated phospholipid phosphatase